PDYEPVWYNKGIALEKLGCYLQAIACFDKVHLRQK
ncbi:MAG: tetratricopeptide repeat protein, partial [Tolypothrix sp. Co-bin9]|nr:tetratricopeptide repeat protein [Tolypothrix sp. Co-bin9]